MEVDDCKCGHPYEAHEIIHWSGKRGQCDFCDCQKAEYRDAGT